MTAQIQVCSVMLNRLCGPACRVVWEGGFVRILPVPIRPLQSPSLLLSVNLDVFIEGNDFDLSCKHTQRQCDIWIIIF